MSRTSSIEDEKMGSMMGSTELAEDFLNDPPQMAWELMREIISRV
jgi:hypothetical protein